ncbi:MAG TPA: isoprenylcysteine carboxylmethyltransferase family protein [Terriglobales bacterium]|jgi:protein-S-isoprenylcysteine O-methyltransferase Ste14
MRDLLQSAGWWLCIVYASIPLFWLAIHPFVQRWRTRQRSPYRVLLPGWATAWIVLALLTFRWRNRLLYESSWSWAPGIILFLCGFWLYYKSTRSFSRRQVSGMAELLPGSQEQQLVLTGIRTRIRHPMYLGHFCEMLGWSIGTGLSVCYGLTAFAVLMGIVMVRMEDDELELRFGEEYRAYRKTVPAFVPKISSVPKI